MVSAGISHVLEENRIEYILLPLNMNFAYDMKWDNTHFCLFTSVCLSICMSALNLNKHCRLTCYQFTLFLIKISDVI
jgi:hypothetical protein